jgi:hypothetical protein
MLAEERESGCEPGRVGHGRGDHDLAIAVACERRRNLKQRLGGSELERRHDDGVRARRLRRLRKRRRG